MRNRAFAKPFIRVLGIGFLFLLMICSPTGLSQILEYRFQNLTVEDGLPSSLVTCTVQDSRGFIWIGTSGGLLRFDGYSFKKFSSISGDSASISSNLITAIARGRSGDLWIGTQDGNLCKLELPSERSRWLNFQGSHSMAVNSIWQARDGVHWVATEGNGIFLIDSGGSVLNHFENKPRIENSLSSNVIYTIAEDLSGRILVGTAAGLNIFDGTHGSFEVYRHHLDEPLSISNDTVRAILSDSSGKTWIGTNLGVDEWDMSIQTIHHLNGINGIVSVLRRHDASHIWVGTYLSGLRRFNHISGTISKFLPIQNKPHSLLGTSVLDILIDRTGTSWIATNGGMSRITSRALQFSFYLREPPSNSKFVSSVAEDQNGNVWIGAMGVQRNDVNWETEATPSSRAHPVFLKEAFVTALFCDREGVIWIGTNRGLFRHPPNTLQFDALPFRNRILAMAEDHEGTIWVGTSPLGLCGINKQTGQISYRIAQAKEKSSELQTANVTRVFVDRDDVVWVGTEGNGLQRLNRDNGTLKKYTHDPLIHTSISNNRVYDIYEDDLRTLWITTGSGLDEFDQATETFAHFSNTDGFPSSQLLNLQEDSRGNLWITADGQSISKFNRVSKRITNFFSEDGFHNTSVMGAFAKISTGEFFIGGTEGFTRFHPDSILDNTIPPPIQITELTVAGKSIAFDREKMNLGMAFPYNENFLGFSYAVLDYVNPERNRHAYRLEGVDPIWIYAEGSHRINYSNLSSGSYALRIKGANSDGYWNEDGITLPITINPPWWETWWFRALGAGTLLALIAVVYNIRVRHLLALERLRLRVASDLHDDLGSVLSSLALSSDVVRRTLPDEHDASKKRLLEMGNVARTAADALRSIVWVIKPGSETMDEMMMTLRTTASRLLRDKELSFSVEGALLRRNLDMEFRRNVALSFNEILNNIMKHAHAHSVDVQVRTEGDKLILLVHDDGKGFDPAASPQGNGLGNLRRRAAAIGGECLLTTAPGKGTTVLITARIP